ncbi:MAG: hypothetical protein DME85_11660 [Verrucomicrobia bacterium]|nr:MAG: hypothetical protein DME85_11660 [Verrucomicrobiota bacterium]
MPKIVEIPNMLLWSQSIGGLIINFGIIEFESLRWIEKLGSVSETLKARKDKLSLRINAAVALIRSSSLSDSDLRTD